jgi:hypothetical protein
MTDIRQIGKYRERSCALIEALSQHLTEGTEESYEKHI